VLLLLARKRRDRRAANQTISKIGNVYAGLKGIVHANCTNGVKTMTEIPRRVKTMNINPETPVPEFHPTVEDVELLTRAYDPARNQFVELPDTARFFAPPTILPRPEMPEVTQGSGEVLSDQEQVEMYGGTVDSEHVLTYEGLCVLAGRLREEHVGNTFLDVITDVEADPSFLEISVSRRDLEWASYTEFRIFRAADALDKLEPGGGQRFVDSCDAQRREAMAEALGEARAERSEKTEGTEADAGNA
jgi:hypothetical protein